MSKLRGTLLIITALLPALSYAQTSVGGVISSDAVWTIDGSPYIALDTVAVNAGVKLSIQPGVTVKFDRRMILQIKGTLVARGTADSMITFTSNQGSPLPGDWGSIQFTNTSTSAAFDSSGSYTSGCILEYCTIELSSSGLLYNAASPYVNQSTIQRTAGNAITIVQHGTIASIIIRNSTIQNNRNVGIFSSAGGKILIENNKILSNETGIFQSSAASTMIVRKNIVYYNYGSGMSSLNANHDTVSMNVFAVNGQALTFESTGTYFVSGNNFTANFGVDRSALFFDLILGPSLSATFVKNLLQTNTGTATVLLNDTSGLSSGLHFQMANCNFVDNTAPYELNNTTFQNQVAQNNWWGTDSDTVVQSRIYDHSDSLTGSYGTVNYSPYLTSMDTSAPIASPSNVAKSGVSAGVKISWSPVAPVADLAGYKVYYGSPTGISFSHVVDVGNVTNHTLSGLTTGDTIAVTAYDALADGIDDQLEGHESWFRQASLVSSVNDYHALLPKAFSLDQNFPNPFNPSTSISFSIPTRTHIRLQVINLLGQVIATLSDEDKQPGTYSVTWGAATEPSGIYFYRMTAGNFVQTKKAILLK